MHHLIQVPDVIILIMYKSIQVPDVPVFILDQQLHLFDFFRWGSGVF